MKVIDKIPFAIDGIVPGAVWVLRLDNKIKVPFCCFTITAVTEV
jgi:hypothetical protein